LRIMEEKLQSKYHEALQERHETVASLVKDVNSQELTIGSLKEEIRSLVDDNELAMKEHEKIVSSLQNKMEHMRLQLQEEQMRCLQKTEALQEQITFLEEELEAKIQQGQKIRYLLEERTKLLGDVVEQNKSLGNDLVEARSLVSELQEESDNYLQEKESAELRYARIEKEMTEKENLAKLQLMEERQHSKKLEQDLMQLKNDVLSARKAEKGLAELNKENILLKDKVKRQEAYLKKKLKNEMDLKKQLQQLDRRQSTSR